MLVCECARIMSVLAGFVSVCVGMCIVSERSLYTCMNFVITCQCACVSVLSARDRVSPCT